MSPFSVPTVSMVNITEDELDFKLSYEGREVHFQVPKHGECEIPKVWAEKREWGGHSHPSVIEMVAPQLVPAEDQRAKNIRAERKGGKAAPKDDQGSK